PPPIPTTTPEPKCPEGWGTNSYISSCFKYYTRPDGQKKSWFEARDFCQAMGGNLLSINNKEEQAAVLSVIVQAAARKSAWIGLVKSDPDEGFQWSDGSPLNFENWDNGEPNNHAGVELCGELRINYRLLWNDLHCENA
ncbi:unnamed protein product, partial [Staurois parvus]